MAREYVYTDRLMGCDLQVSLVIGDEGEAKDIYCHLYDVGNQYESQFSRFIATSELFRLNKKHTVVASETFIHILSIAQELCRETNGVYNPCVRIGQYGYDVSFEKLIERDIKIKHRNINPVRHTCVNIEKRGNHITLTEDQMLDFGGFLKGYVAQLLAGEAIQSGCGGVIVNLGGDIYTRGYDAENVPFIFSIYNPVTKEDISIGEHTDCAIATSGTYKRKWRVGDKTYTHIIGTEGVPVSHLEVISATVWMKDGARADAYATVAIALGISRAERFFKEHAIPAVLIAGDGAVRVC